MLTASVVLFALVCAAGDLEAENSAHVAEARACLEREDSAKALTELELAIECLPFDVDTLMLASEVALEAGDKDRSHWYASLALDAPVEDETVAEALRKQWIANDPLEGAGLAVRDAYATYLLELGGVAAKQKLYLNAVDLLGRCKGTSREAEANEIVAMLYRNKLAAAAMLTTGIVVPGQERVRKKSANRIRREDKQHTNWARAWKLKSRNYTLKTNVGQEFAAELLQAMEQMNKFYRGFFRHKAHGDRTAPCELSVYKNRADFDEFEPGFPQEVWGFFNPAESSLKIFDSRSKGKPLLAFYSILFHEASHQFTEIVSDGVVPCWLNEGTASYFEGTRILQNGVVETNLVPEGRLETLVMLLERNALGLKDVVSYHQPGSYPGAYYPFGWGLVYFLRNYEDDRSERVYLEPYEEFMDSYREDSGPHYAYDRFVEIFVTKPKQRGIDTFADFEKRFRDWILELGAIYFGPEARADDLIARGRKQAGNRKREAAIESYRFALRKRPGDAVAAFELGEVHASGREHDAAAYRFRQALAFARADLEQAKALLATHGEPVAECMKRVLRINRGFAEKIAKSEAQLIVDSFQQATAYGEAGYPLMALHVLSSNERMLGAELRMSLARQSLMDEYGVDTRRWKRVSFDDVKWRASETWTADGDPGAEFTFLGGELPKRYRVEVTISPAEVEEGLVAGLLFSSNEDSGYNAFVVDAQGKAQLLHLDHQRTRLQSWQVKLEPGEPFQLAVEVEPRRATFFVNGKLIGARAYVPSTLAGRVGLYTESAEFGFRALRLRLP